MTNIDMNDIRQRKHDPALIAQVDKDVLNMLVKLAHANGWNIKGLLEGARSKISEATDDPALQQAYQDRLGVLLDGMD